MASSLLLEAVPGKKPQYGKNINEEAIKGAA